MGIGQGRAAHIDGHRPQEIQSLFGATLSLAQVHAALAYYYDHQAEIDKDFAEDEQLGRDAERTPLNVEAVRVHDLPLTRVRTVYDRIGDVAAWGALAAFAIASFAAWRRR